MSIQIGSIPTTNVFIIPKFLPKDNFYISIRAVKDNLNVSFDFNAAIDQINIRMLSQVESIIAQLYALALRILPKRSGKLIDQFVNYSTLDYDPTGNGLRFSVTTVLPIEYPKIIPHSQHSGQQGFAPLYPLINPIPVQIIKTTPKGAIYLLNDPMARDNYESEFAMEANQIIYQYIYNALIGYKLTLIFTSEIQQKISGLVDLTNSILSSYNVMESNDIMGYINTLTAYNTDRRKIITSPSNVEIGKIASGKGRYRISAVQGAKIFINGSNLNVSWLGKSNTFIGLQLGEKASFNGVQLP
jgi:hypothetical protein